MLSIEPEDRPRNGEDDFAASRKFIFLRSKGSDDADVRLHSDPLVHVLVEQSIPVLLVDPRTQAMPLDEPCTVVFHFDDIPAARCLAGLAGKLTGCVVVCLGCDMYSFEPYLWLTSFTDLFLMPTDVHRKVLASWLSKPVFTLGEVVDPTASDGRPLAWDKEPSSHAKPRTFWFGYPASFEKSMASLIPVIEQAVRQDKIACFDVITDIEAFDNTHHLPVVAYNGAKFRAQARQYDYTILSHFSLDLTVNTFIKSPNKAVAALAAGVIPLASDTPNYRALYNHLGLERFLFSSPAELSSMLSNLDPKRDFAFVDHSMAIEKLEALCSHSAILQAFDNAMTSYRDGAHEDISSLYPAYTERKRSFGERVRGRFEMMVGPKAARRLRTFGRR